jgi:hypothetical protein
MGLGHEDRLRVCCEVATDCNPASSRSTAVLLPDSWAFAAASSRCTINTTDSSLAAAERLGRGVLRRIAGAEVDRSEYRDTHHSCQQLARFLDDVATTSDAMARWASSL